MNPNVDINVWLRRRELEARVEGLTLEKWLGILHPIRWVMVAASTVLSALAGAVYQGAKTGQSLASHAGIFGLVALIITTLHTGLHCDSHQALCSRVLSDFRGIEAGYQTAQSEEGAVQHAMKKDLDKRYEKAVAEGADLAPKRYRNKAETEILATP